MSETTPETPQDTPETEDVLPETTSQRTYVQDDGHGPLPEDAVEQSGPTTYHADHVPDDAPTLLTTKVVRPPATETAAASTAVVETAAGRDIPLEGTATLTADAAHLADGA